MQDDAFTGVLDAARAGRADALGTLMQDATGLAWRALLRFRTLSEAQREDLAHDVVLRLLERGLHQFDGGTALEWRAYVRRMAVNGAISLMRRGDWELTVFWDLEVAADDDPGQQVVEREAMRMLADCVSVLPVLDQEIFWMRTRELPYNEMVERLGVPQGTIASKYNRARDKVTHCLEEVGLV